MIDNFCLCHVIYQIVGIRKYFYNFIVSEAVCKLFIKMVDMFLTLPSFSTDSIYYYHNYPYAYFLYSSVA